MENVTHLESWNVGDIEKDVKSKIQKLCSVFRRFESILEIQSNYSKNEISTQLSFLLPYMHFKNEKPAPKLAVW